MVKIYGSSDDLVCLDNSTYGVDEIGCFDVKGVRLFLDDDTILVVRYTNGIWRIEIERKGTAPYQHTVCPGDDEDDYSDVFCTESDVIAHEKAFENRYFRYPGRTWCFLVCKNSKAPDHDSARISRRVRCDKISKLCWKASGI